MRRVRDAATTFSITCRAFAFSAAFVDVRNALSSRETTWLTMRVTAGVPSTSLVCPSNCGSASRTVTTAVMPSSTSSLTMSGSPDFSSLVVRRVSLKVFVTPRSKPCTCVPPLGVAMMLTNERSSDS